MRVQPTGKKTFVYRDRRGGKDQWITLGSYPGLMLHEARTKAAAIKGGASAESLSVKDAYDKWYKHLSTQYRRPEITDQMMQANILSRFAHRSMTSLNKPEVVAAIQAVADRGSFVMANRLLSQTRNFMDYAKDHGWITANPLDGVQRKNIGGREAVRTTVLTDDEIVGLFKSRLSRGNKMVLLLALLTGQRMSEVLSIFTAPVEDSWVVVQSKVDRPNKVYLASLASKILKSNVTVPKDHRVLSKALLRIGAPFTPHDLRRTMATALAGMSVPPHVVEKMLNHQMEGVMAVYNHAEYLTEKAQAWCLWDCYITRLLSEGQCPLETF